MKKVIGTFLFCAALSIFVFTLGRSVFYTGTGEDSGLTAAVGSTTTSSMGRVIPKSEYPTRLEIPALNISANVQYVGIKGNGDMANPNNFTDVGWYKLGTVPGEVGSAVMAGHVDNGLALSGVFKHLSDVKVGDDLFVTRKDGTRLRFIVTDVVSYPYTNAPAEKIFNTNDAARLNLITCTGNWVAGAKTYDKRLIVYSKLAS